MNKSFKLLISSLLAATCTCGPIAAQESYVVASPDGNIQLSVSAGEQLAVALLVDGEQLATTPVGLDIRQYGVVGSNPVINSVERNHVEGEIKVVIGENPSVYENYNEMTLNLGDYSLVCRAYDEGVAWRLVTRIDGDIIITDEVVDFTFAGNPAVWFSEAPESMSQWELSYEKYESAAAIPDGLFSVNPMMIKYEDTGLGLTIIESDIDDYPGMFLRSSADGHLHGKWAQYPNTIQNSSIYDSQAVLSRYDYIARTVGTREYPWRGIIVSRSDVELLNNDFIYKLAKPQKLADTSWIKAGKTGFDWLVDGVLEGVDIPNGPDEPRTLELYKYWVDFCAEYGLEYMTCDAGWDEGYMAELCQYAAERGVRIFVWDFFNMMLNDEARLDRFKRYGIAGIKVDFIARDDQIAIGWLTRMAELTAKRQMLLLMHGCPKPTGLNRTYPNIISYEAVHGLENNKWDYSCNPTYMVQFPFLRMLGGSVDATPGMLSNCTYRRFRIKPTGRPDMWGTRANAMAMYVVFHQALGFVSDSPVEYRKVPEIMEFLKRVPTVWDETLPLQGEMGEYIVMARRSGEDWYVGAMNNALREESNYSRTVEIDFSFLTPGEEYEAYVIKDTDMSNREATDCAIETIELNSESKISYYLANGGGMAMRIYPKGQGGIENTVAGGDDAIKISYRPAGEAVSVESTSPVTAVYMADMLGRVVPVNATLPASHFSVSLEGVDKGVYCFVVVTADMKKTLQFIKY